MRSPNQTITESNIHETFEESTSSSKDEQEYNGIDVRTPSPLDLDNFSQNGREQMCTDLDSSVNSFAVAETTSTTGDEPMQADLVDFPTDGNDEQYTNDSENADYSVSNYHRNDSLNGILKLPAVIPILSLIFTRFFLTF